MSTIWDALVIGGGFFGCRVAQHLASFLDGVVMVEEAEDLLQRASYANQARVHQGYHYPRSLLTAIRSRVNFARFAGSANGSTWYFNDWVSDAPLFFVSAPTSAAWPIMFDRSSLDPRPATPYVFDVASAMGPFFLRSSLAQSYIRVGQTDLAQSYVIRMQSQIPDWSGTVAPAPRGQADEIDW